MPLAECSASAVLSAEPHRSALQHERAESQRFRSGPIDGRAIEDFLTLLEKSFQLRMHVKLVWKACDALYHALERGPIHGRVGTRRDHLFGIHRAQLLNLIFLAILFRRVVDIVEPLVD